jgi:cytochrome b involved in lipid metabolism
MGLILGTWFILELYYRVANREQRAKILNSQNDQVTYLTVEDFKYRLLRRGEKLVILDDRVLSIESYLNTHPGSAYVLNHNIGRDISKFFYGGYAMKDYFPQTHSYSAMRVATSL